jgi:hypothetical protein
MSQSTTAPWNRAEPAETRSTRYARFAARRVGRWRRQQVLITVIEVLFVAAGRVILLR